MCKRVDGPNGPNFGPLRVTLNSLEERKTNIKVTSRVAEQDPAGSECFVWIRILTRSDKDWDLKLCFAFIAVIIQYQYINHIGFYLNR